MIRGTSYDQDSRFPDKNKRMLENSIWPDHYSCKIDLSKVDIEIISLWVERRIQSIMGETDDIISGTVIGMLEQFVQKQQKPNAKEIHITLSGFLKQKTLTFVSDLWNLLDDAQKSSNGIPKILIEEKKKQQIQEKKKIEQLSKKKQRIIEKKFKLHTHKRHRSRSYQHEKKKRQESYDSRQRNKKHKKECQFQSKKHKHKKNKYHKESSQKKQRKQSTKYKKSAQISDSSGVISSSS